MKNKILFLVIFLFLLISTSAFAGSSATYSITSDVFSNGGSVGSISAAYRMNDIIAQDLLIGISSSIHYMLSAGRYIYINTTPPPVPVITVPADNPHTQEVLTVAISGTCDAITYSIHMNGSAAGVTYIAGATTWTYSGTLTGKDVTYSVTALDSLGNESSADTVNILLDLSADHDVDSLPHYYEDEYSLDDNDPNYPNGYASDSDHDGQTNYQEYLADTDPKSGTSIFKVSTMSVTSGVGVNVQFPTSLKRQYAIYYSDNSYSDSMTWTLATTVTGTGGTYTWTDNGTFTGTSPLNSSILHRYYKLVPSFTSAWNPASPSGLSEPINIALTANVSASSEYNSSYSAVMAVDGVYGAWDTNEWASNGEMTPWLRLNWPSAQQMNKVVLYDRCNPVDHINDGWLRFYKNGGLVKEIHVGMFPYGGGAKEIIFNMIEADAVKLEVTSGKGSNIGLSEMMVYYDTNIAAQQASNLASSAGISASSEYNSNYSAVMAVDGVYGAWDTNEWASNGEMTPWLRLNWPSAQQMNKVVLYDRCNPVDHINDGWLRFYKNGGLVKEIHVGMFPYGGGAKEIIFNMIEADAVKLEVTSGKGSNIGLSEMMVYYDTNIAAQQASNLASSAGISASSEYNSNYSVVMAVDGVYGAWDTNEWASNGEMTPWLRLNWPSAQQMNKVVLYDRCNPVDHINDGWLRFYKNGGLVKEIHVGMFPYGGGAKEIIFNMIEADAVKLEVTSGKGSNIGLSEIMVYYDI